MADRSTIGLRVDDDDGEEVGEVSGDEGVGLWRT
eukprot:CAMPEP_0198268830 /NCGR_PEP_ID=MMETSP1447-20131203/38941_1 /TAXON_ID=420782 /ORGANISM="Chaetoceros dichaeta, Strain CCMP1751" /LENGTH=33 /DNA_ID= /DNA_START= /DNA_END= /DNA_ORIENTATION=